MHWSSEKFSSLHAAALSGSDDEFLSEVDAIKDDLAALLATPAKSETSRANLAKRILTIGGAEYSLNSQFLDAAAQVADELNIDEIVAAQLVFFSTNDATALELEPLEAAVSLYYVRRQYILDLVLFIVDKQELSKGVWTDLVSKVLSAQPISHILSAARAVEQGLEDLAEKTKRGDFLGMSGNARFGQLIKLQKDFLIREYETLTCLLYAVCNGREFVSVNGFQSILQVAATVEAFDPRFLIYFLAASAAILTLKKEDFKAVQTQVINTPVDHWKLGYMKAALLLIYLPRALELESMKFPEVMEQGRVAVDAGGVECLLALAQDGWSFLKAEPELIDIKPIVRQRTRQYAPWSTAAVNTRIWSDISSLLDTAAVNIVTHLADILKEMRLSEEDMYLALAQDDATMDGQNNATGPGEDLERFFLFVSYLYKGKPDAGVKWWSDLSSSLGGFLIWSSECQLSFMSATSTQMISSLSCGPVAAGLASKFLSRQVNSSLETFELSWTSVYDVVAYYINGLTSNKDSAASSTSLPNSGAVIASGTTSGTNSSATPAPQAHKTQNLLAVTMPNVGAQQTHVTLDDDTILVLGSYLQLVQQIIKYDPEARKACRQENRDLVRLLFELLRAQTPLTAVVLSTLAGFASTPNENEALSMWNRLHEWAFYPVGPGGRSQPKFDEVLTSLPDALAFLELLEAFNYNPDSLRLSEYIKFVLNEVFVWASCISESDFKCQLHMHAMSFAQKVPVQMVLPSFSERPILRSLFGIISEQADNISALPPGHPGVEVVIMAVNLIQYLLPHGFEEQVLYNLSVIPNLGLYAGQTAHSELAVSSLHLLNFLQAGIHFRPTVTRKSRLLTILESASDASRIRLDLARQLTTGTPAVTRALLDLLAAPTRSGGSLASSPAQQLLGFSSSSSYDGMELDNQIGGVKTGTSLLASVLTLLTTSFALLSSTDIITNDDARTARLCSDILAGILRDSLVRQEFLNWLRPKDYIFKLLEVTPIMSSGQSFESDEAEVDYLWARAVLLEAIMREVEECDSQKLLGRHQRYVKAIERIILSLLVEPSYFVKPSLRKSQLACLRAWCELVPLLTEAGDGFVLQIMRTLVPRLASSSRDDPSFCGPVASLLVLLLERRPLLKSEAPNALFNAALLAVPPAAALPELRTDLYTVCYQLMLGDLPLEANAGPTVARTRTTLSEKLSAVINAGDSLLRIICTDALASSTQELCIVSLTLLQVLAAASRKNNQALVAEILVRYNMLRPLVALATSSNTQGKVVKLALALLLEVAQTRVGARNLLWCGLFDALDNALGRIREHDYSTLLVAVQLLAAMAMSMGSANEPVTTRIRQLLQHHHALVMAFLRADASNPLQLGETPSTVAQLAQILTVLLAITHVSSLKELAPEWPLEDPRIPEHNY